MSPIRDDHLTIVPASQASWADLSVLFGAADANRCQCQRLKVPGCFWRDTTHIARTAMLRAQTACGEAGAGETSGLVAYLDAEPAGWVAVEPRTAYPKLGTHRVPWVGRDEDKDDDTVWAVTCFLVRKGFRRLGLTYALARAAVEHARAHGARALEGYPIATQPGRELPWGEAHVGVVQVFADAGFREVSRPTVRRVVMRIDFAECSDG